MQWGLVCLVSNVPGDKVREEMEGLEVWEERGLEAKIAVEEDPSTDAMGKCLWVQCVLWSMSFLAFTAWHGFLLLC